MEAAGRRAERTAEQRRKQQLREQELEEARLAVQAYDQYLDRLLSVHKHCSRPCDWQAIANAKPPEQPFHSNRHEQEAQQKLATYEPGFFSKALGREGKKRAALGRAVIEARQEDSETYAKAADRYKHDVAVFDKRRRMAEGVLAGDLASYQSAISDAEAFSDIEELGTSLEFSATEPRCIEVSLRVNSEELIPSEQGTLLRSGRLSLKAMPKARFYELYQDHVCSCVLRVARELFALLPIQMAVVHAVSELLNSATGHLEWQPILSVAVPRETLDRLNLSTIDCSESMRNFVHNTNFKKMRGFTTCERLQPDDFKLA